MGQDRIRKRWKAQDFFDQESGGAAGGCLEGRAGPIAADSKPVDLGAVILKYPRYNEGGV